MKLTQFGLDSGASTSGQASAGGSTCPLVDAEDPGNSEASADTPIAKTAPKPEEGQLLGGLQPDHE